MFVEIPSSARSTDEATITVTESHDDSTAADLDVTSKVIQCNQYVTASAVSIMYSSDSNQFNISITNNGNSVVSYKFSKGSNVPDGWNFEATLIFETQQLDPYGGIEALFFL